MAGSALKIIQEELRRNLTGDVKFVQKLLYYFELRLPEDITSLLGRSSFFFPLVINPQGYTMDEPFALERTFTQGGGMYVEEHGIIERVITLRGNTGFKPRTMHRDPLMLLADPPEAKSHSRILSAFALDKLSGQRHFQYLQDAVFRTYADYKRDPATAERTQLFFHNPKDDESWLVAPRRFTLERSSDKPATYNYTIELLVLGPAAIADETFSEDAALLEQLRSAIQEVKNAIAMVSGAINDLTNLVAEIEGLVKGVASAIDTVGDVIDAATNFVNGVTDLIEAPYAIINSLQEVFDSGSAFLETVDNFPDNARQAFRRLTDGLDRLGTHPEVFETSTQAEMRKNRERQELTLAVSSATLAAAAASSPPASLAAFAAMGTAITPGEAQAAEGVTTAGRSQPAYTGAQQYEVTSGDTLVSLAARYLGDARLWQHIAVVNGLKPPFINDQAGADLTDLRESPLPGAVGVGRKLLIPNFAKPPASQPQLPVLGVQLEAPAEEHFLGADLALVPVTGENGRTRYDLAIDTDGGSIDAKIVRGVPNLVQALKVRLATEKGTDLLYRNLGVARVIGLNMGPVDTTLAKFRILEAMSADPRVGAVRKVAFQAAEESPDLLEVEAEVEVRGFTQTSNVKSVLGTS